MSDKIVVSSGNGHTSVTIIDGEITIMRTGNFREGGIIWSKNYPKSNGGKRSCLKSIFNDGGEAFYNKVVKVATSEALPTVAQLKASRRKVDIARAQKEVERAEAALDKAKRELRRAKR